MTAPERKAHMNAGAMPLRASTAVRAFANVAIFIPKNPDNTDVAAPKRNEIVEKIPFHNAGAFPSFFPASKKSSQPSSELNRTNTIKPKTP